MNEQDSDAEKGIGIKTLKKRGGGGIWENPEQAGSATYWKNISRQEKDSSYVFYSMGSDNCFPMVEAAGK